jgi:hypothetical protein
MDAYTFSLILGAAGLGVMAVGGLAAGHGHHGGDGHHHSGDSGHHGAHAGHGHGHHASDVSLGGAHGHGSHAHGGVHGAEAATSARAAGGSGVLSHGPRGGGSSARGRASALLWSLLSPRVLFSVLVGFGATGLLARNALDGAPLLLLAALGGVLFEAALVRPLWNLAFRFASAPALTLASALFDEARATSRFDANGQGLIAVEVDGQVVQVLGTLRPEERTAGVRVRAGDRVRIEEVDEERGRCVVSLL